MIEIKAVKSEKQEVSPSFYKIKVFENLVYISQSSSLYF